MILVDSSVWIPFFNGQDLPQVNKLDDLLGAEPVLVGDLILTEVLQGFRHDKDYRTAFDLLAVLEMRDIVGYKTAIAAADNYRILRRKGITVRKTIDMLIGTYCILHNIQLLHNDRDFEPLEKHIGLQSY